MKNFTLTIIFALITVAQVSAKKAFAGYVINTDGEKIEGQVVVVSPTYNELKVKFIHTNNKKETFDLVSQKIQAQVARTRTEESSPKNTTLYFSLLLETKDLIEEIMNLLDLYHNEHQQS